MEHATQHRFDAVLVWKLDRFGRSVRHLVNALAELEGQGISFVSQRHSPIDCRTGAGMLKKLGTTVGSIEARTIQTSRSKPPPTAWRPRVFSQEPGQKAAAPIPRKFAASTR